MTRIEVAEYTPASTLTIPCRTDRSGGVRRIRVVNEPTPTYTAEHGWVMPATAGEPFVINGVTLALHESVDFVWSPRLQAWRRMERFRDYYCSDLTNPLAYFAGVECHAVRVTEPLGVVVTDARLDLDAVFREVVAETRTVVRQREDDPSLCNHANECPHNCPCRSGCYCKTRTCAS